MRSSSPAPGVVLLRWPEQAEEAARLAHAGVARLLLVSPEADPPDSPDTTQDWVRLPADERDVTARIARLTHTEAATPTPPVVDASGRLFYRGTWVALSPIEARMAGVLAESFGAVVTEEELGRHGWPDGAWPAGALRVHLTRLRQRLAPLGLEICRVRLRGVVLQHRDELEDARAHAARW